MIGAALLLALQPTPVSAEGRWAAFELPSHCEARGRAWRELKDATEQPRIAFSFRPDGRIEMFANLRRVMREGATVMIAVDGQPFLLAGQGRQAWSQGNEQAIIAALRTGSRLRVTATDRAGRRFTDYYPIDGVQTAIDAAAACAAKKAGNKGA